MARGCRAGLVLASVLVMGLSACGAPPPPSFDLAAAPVAERIVSARSAHAVIGVALPTASSLLDSQRIVMRTPHGTAYLKGAQWTARLPHLVQSRLIESFERSGQFAAVAPADASSPIVLEIILRTFEADVSRSEAHVEVHARIVAPGGRIVAAEDFSGTAPAPHDDGPAVTAALEQALSKVLRQLAGWTAHKV